MVSRVDAENFPARPLARFRGREGRLAISIVAKVGRGRLIDVVDTARSDFFTVGKGVQRLGVSGVSSVSLPRQMRRLQWTTQLYHE